MDVADLTVECLVLETCGGLGGRRQLAFDPRPGEGLDGPPAAPGLQHCLVFRT